MAFRQLIKPYLYLAVPLALMVAFFGVPLAQAVWMSLHDYSQSLYQPTFVGLGNYVRLAQSAPFHQAVGNTLVFMLGVLPAMVTLPIGLAVLLNGRLKGMAVFRTLIYLPVVVSMVAVGIAWKWLYAKDGLINAMLATVGLWPVDWLVSPDVALLAVMMMVVWKGLAYYMMMYLAQLQSVADELYDAATIDGASEWQKHWHVTLPHLRPTMLLVAIISTIGGLKVFTEIYVLTQGGPLGATQTVVYYIYQRAFENLDLGVASAAGILLMGVLLILSIIQIRFFNQVDEDPMPARHGGPAR